MRWYQIKVRGSVPVKWSERLGGMTIRYASDPEEGSVTWLEGRLRGQAALAGVCDTLYQFHLPILEISSRADDAPVKAADRVETTG
jgi:hypothetical protein